MDVVAERFGGRGGDSPEEKRVPWWVAAFHLTPHEFRRLFLEMQVRPRTRGARTGTGGAGVTRCSVCCVCVWACALANRGMPHTTNIHTIAVIDRLTRMDRTSR